MDGQFNLHKPGMQSYDGVISQNISESLCVLHRMLETFTINIWYLGFQLDNIKAVNQVLIIKKFVIKFHSPIDIFVMFIIIIFVFYLYQNERIDYNELVTMM
ncbi:hypothetical protein Ahy_A04g017881 isoform A [Arachis hypogaea]|uniref:Uncharacterized protein n=1 Tax=Arachis hypogaea TaxID=3818 RepID=A0A445DCA4_ARAHY|nr:hypothetical protein Ahy_A04g017881 isoform A [Arachis hypogaea]